ncbi:DUF3570 domain-containing protein [Hymenobacter chitinivorans]|uniref:Uncharacterized protein DUF3570 n=1 Tax=Hymenobacter chitinivorans DSM 11115 TaxID=1121954 RepID=A0A2M9BQL2_9BACT|nr:DUF3570 domain-containing protein [Hymenobacter chitinivorans]PJJ60236.1 uncharacterized protein DUF3570 [Hymenobacter chitinivorans DSM 11115]
MKNSALLLSLSLGLLVPLKSLAQGGNTQNRVDGYGAPATPAATRGAAGETELNILMSYYQQDGSHGAVEGGRGTEHLTNLTPTIILNVPLDTLSRLSANLGMDVYASASTDRIDQVLSSPSSSDTRFHADFGYTRQLPGRRSIVGLGAGVSTEYDYKSVNVAASWAQTSRDGNRELSVAGQVFFDQATIIRPVELRTNGRKEDGSAPRQSYNLSAVLSQVLTQRLQVSVSTELVYQKGLLSTPFHRVYFQGSTGALGEAKVEALPGSRFKYPVGLRLSYYASDLVLLRGYYRFYNDDFGIRAHTLELETPVKITPFFVVYPFYRYHTQTQARYFAPYLQHQPGEQFYTSDYDLSGFSANKLGLGLRYSPVYGIGRFKTPFGGRIAQFKALDLRYAHYRRSTDLTADIFSADFSFILP